MKITNWFRRNDKVQVGQDQIVKYVLDIVENLDHLKQSYQSLDFDSFNDKWVNTQVLKELCQGLLMAVKETKSKNKLLLSVTSMETTEANIILTFLAQMFFAQHFPKERLLVIIPKGGGSQDIEEILKTDDNATKLEWNGKDWKIVGKSKVVFMLPQQIKDLVDAESNIIQNSFMLVGNLEAFIMESPSYCGEKSREIFELALIGEGGYNPGFNKDAMENAVTLLKLSDGLLAYIKSLYEKVENFIKGGDRPLEYLPYYGFELYGKDLCDEIHKTSQEEFQRSVKTISDKLRHEAMKHHFVYEPSEDRQFTILNENEEILEKKIPADELEAFSVLVAISRSTGQPLDRMTALCSYLQQHTIPEYVVSAIKCAKGVMGYCGDVLSAKMRLKELDFQFKEIQSNEVNNRSESIAKIKKMQWEELPIKGKTIKEQETEYSEQFLGPNSLDINCKIMIPPSNFVEKCVGDVPVFYKYDSEPMCVMKLQGNPENIHPGIIESIEKNDIYLTAKFFSYPTYPIISLVLNIPTSSKVYRLEALPDFTDAYLIECMSLLAEKQYGMFHLFTGDTLTQLAKGMFKLSSVNQLEECFNKAAVQLKNIKPDEQDYQTAYQEHLRTTSLYD